MNLSLSSLGINSTTSTTSVSKQGPSSPRESTSVGEATSVAVSKPGELLAALQDLKDTNPDTFSSVVSKLAQEVRDQAKDTSGREQKGLNRLAEQLDKVASTQDLTALQPPQGEHRTRGARAYPSSPPPDAANDGDTDGTQASTAVSASPQPTDPRAAMDAVLTGLIKQVQAATSSTASSELASSTTSPVSASTT